MVYQIVITYKFNEYHYRIDSIIMPFTMFAVNNQLKSLSSTGCVCPDDVLSFTCTAVGSGSTIWNGTAFECTGNEIILRHSAFNGMDGISGECNNRAIIARSLSVDDMSYTSQLNVTVSDGIHNKSVACYVRVANGTILPIGSSPLIIVASGNLR